MQAVLLNLRNEIAENGLPILRINEAILQVEIDWNQAYSQELDLKKEKLPPRP
jgi:hypothetical protein